jgi:hypothetical protein
MVRPRGSVVRHAAMQTRGRDGASISGRGSFATRSDNPGVSSAVGHGACPARKGPDLAVAAHKDRVKQIMRRQGGPVLLVAHCGSVLGIGQARSKTAAIPRETRSQPHDGRYSAQPNAEDFRPGLEPWNRRDHEAMLEILDPEVEFSALLQPAVGGGGRRLSGSERVRARHRPAVQLGHRCFDAPRIRLRPTSQLHPPQDQRETGRYHRDSGRQPGSDPGE